MAAGFHRLTLSLSLSLAIAALAVIGSAGCSRGGSSARAFDAIDITGADYANALNLPDVDGKPRRLSDFNGKVTVVFFGYTQCPDVCPATLAELAQVKKLLGADGERVQPVFVTVDPERDTPALLKAYVANFGGDIVALRGSVDETRATVKNFRASFNKVPGKDGAAYTVDHTAGSYVFDAKGHVRLFARYGASVESLSGDLKQLLSESS